MSSGYSTSNLEAFVDTVRLKSFSAVARKRGMTASSIARQVSALEGELGVPLFNRSTRSLVLTEAGQALFERSERILQELEAAKSEAVSFNDTVCGRLRVCCWPTFGRRHVIPHLAELFERYPDLQIELDLSERLHDPTLDRAGLMIRIGELTDSTLLATRLATHRSVIVASPEYLARHGAPATLDECREHRLIDKTHPAAYMGWRTWLGESRGVRQQFVFESDDLQAQSDVCVDGGGIAHLPDWVVFDQVSAGRLRVLSIEGVTQETGIYLLRNPGVATRAVRAFTEHLRDKIGSPAIWEGTLAAQTASF